MARDNQDLTEIFDLIEYPEAYCTTYLANSMVFPAYDAIYRDFGLVRAEYILLVCLSHYDNLTAQDIADISRRPRNTISRAVRRMVDEGHIVRTPDPDDRRQIKLQITDTGSDLHDRIAPYLTERQDVVFGTLNVTERKVLFRLLMKTAKNVATQKK